MKTEDEVIKTNQRMIKVVRKKGLKCFTQMKQVEI